jgi:hypothetical protein
MRRQSPRIQKEQIPSEAGKEPRPAQLDTSSLPRCLAQIDTMQLVPNQRAKGVTAISGTNYMLMVILMMVLLFVLLNVAPLIISA